MNFPLLVGGGNAFAAFSGHNGAGACTVAAAVAGDVVLNVMNLGGGGSFGSDMTSSFEPVVTVTGQVQQTSASNLSAITFLALLRRG